MNTKLGFFWGGGRVSKCFSGVISFIFLEPKVCRKFRKRKLGSRCSSYGFEE